MFDPSQVSVNDLLQMFEHSLVTYDKKPVYVIVPDEKKNLKFVEISKTEQKSRHISDKAWDFKPVTLGACQVGNNTVFMYRVPHRQYKQGTCFRNVNYRVISDSNELPRGESHILQGFNFKSLEDCIMGNYETFEQVVKAFDVNKDVLSKPISREFALTRELELWFRDMKVGLINEENGKAMFKRGSKFLASLFETEVKHA